MIFFKYNWVDTDLIVHINEAWLKRIYITEWKAKIVDIFKVLL